jgi:glyceraldehyde 3-phosphate dehydrogenase
MAKKVMINGFGRIGRNFFRTVWKNPEIEVLYINDLFHPKYLAYVLKYDSVYGRFDADVEYEEDALIIDGKRIPCTRERDPANLPHSEHDVYVVVESTGFFTDREGASKHLEAGAEKVLISAPAKNPDITIVMGCNDEKLKDEHKIISNASCTTNCLGPIVKVLNESFGIVDGLMTTIHSYTSTQVPVDTVKAGDPIKMTRGRACAANIIPTSTGAAKAIGEVFPELDGKLDGMAMRVPTVDGSVVDLKVNVEITPTVDDVNQKMKEYAEGELKGILAYNPDPIVSKDIIGNPHSSIFCPIWTTVINKHVSVVSWYDNEIGFSNRMPDMIIQKL